MSAQALLDRLRSRGIELYAGPVGVVRCRAPVGVITADVLAEVRAARGDLLALLTAPPSDPRFTIPADIVEAARRDLIPPWHPRRTLPSGGWVNDANVAIRGSLENGRFAWDRAHAPERTPEERRYWQVIADREAGDLAAIVAWLTSGGEECGADARTT